MPCASRGRGIAGRARWLVKLFESAAAVVDDEVAGEDAATFPGAFQPEGAAPVDARDGLANKQVVNPGRSQVSLLGGEVGQRHVPRSVLKPREGLPPQDVKRHGDAHKERHAP